MEDLKKFGDAQRKLKTKEKLDALLLEGLTSGDPIPADAKFWADLKQVALGRPVSHKSNAKE